MSQSDSERALHALVNGDVVSCVVRTSTAAGCSSLTLEMPDGARFESGSAVDFEDALVDLRAMLDEGGVLLLCNRFRRNAFVSSLARQMSNGSGCYLVEMGETVNPEAIVESLAAAPVSEVVAASESGAFIAGWIDSFAS